MSQSNTSTPEKKLSYKETLAEYAAMRLALRRQEEARLPHVRTLRELAIGVLLTRDSIAELRAMARAGKGGKMDPEETEDYASTWDYFDHDLCGWDYFLENIEEILNTNFGAIEDARAEIDETAPALPDEEEETEPPAVRDAAATPTATRPYWQQ